jgi:hypothetical protein
MITLAPVESAPKVDRLLELDVHVASSGPYRSEVLGSKPEPVTIEVKNPSDYTRDLSSPLLTFIVRRGATPIRCAPGGGVPAQDPTSVAPGASATFLRALCVLPLPGHYDVRVVASFGGRPARATSFAFDVVPTQKNLPRPLASYPNVLAALGADLTGMKLTRPEWQSGAYRVGLRVTNTATVPTPLGDATMIFRVTKEGRSLACSDTKPVKLAPRLAPGESATATIPVTCLVDVEGRYEIHASLVFARDGVETELGEIFVQVTSDPLIYLPIWPY